MRRKDDSIVVGHFLQKGSHHLLAEDLTVRTPTFSLFRFKMDCTSWTHLPFLLLIMVTTTAALTPTTNNGNQSDSVPASTRRILRDDEERQQLLLRAGGGKIPEILQRLGLQREGIDTLEVSVGPYNKGESPIYFIKLPPSPYFFKHNQRPEPYTDAPEKTSRLPKPTKLDVNFVNNGKPSQLHHWNLPLTSASHLAFDNLKNLPSGPPSSTPAPVSTTTMAPQPTTTPSTTTAKSTTPATSKVAQGPTQRPSVLNSFWPTPKIPHVLKKKYYYNGQPSGVYVWRPKQKPLAVARHPYFQHFNY
ncbi:uncharacterized protein LOC143024579 [Oratosquilla oratoria]|uniref:uncharacterized protein LOC143024579 n=1 Tax=Oratosquilla oratoria TaxID=337810 RepID=UPI003F7576CC